MYMLSFDFNFISQYTSIGGSLLLIHTLFERHDVQEFKLKSIHEPLVFAQWWKRADNLPALASMISMPESVSSRIKSLCYVESGLSFAIEFPKGRRKWEKRFMLHSILKNRSAQTAHEVPIWWNLLLLTNQFCLVISDMLSLVLCIEFMRSEI